MNTTTRTNTTERLGQALGHRWRAYVRGERRASNWLVSKGVPTIGTVSQPHGQERLSALQRLHLTFLIHAKHERAIRRVQVQPHDIPNFLDEKRIVGQLERLATMGLHTNQLQAMTGES